MRNFNEGQDLIDNVGIDGLPTPGSVFIWKCDQQESDVDPTMVSANLTKTSGTTTITVAAITSASRIKDFGALAFTADTADTTARSLVVSTKGSGVSGDKIWLIENITDGTAYNSTTQGPLYVDDASEKDAYLSEA